MLDSLTEQMASERTTKCSALLDCFIVAHILFPDKTKPKAKKKEEPSSIFQRQRVDALLLDLRQKFPPKFVQVFGSRLPLQSIVGCL